METVDWQVNKASLECAKYMLENQVKCDVSFKVGEEKEVIKAHKFILSMRSPVFEAMFNGSFCESESDPVIPDIGPAAFKALLRYCYYDCLDIKGDDALSLLYAATKYMLPILEGAARKTLIKELDPSKIWDAWKYSTKVGDKELEHGCSAYLKENLRAVNVLEVTKYAVSIGDAELHVCCRKFIKKQLCANNIWKVYNYALKEVDKLIHPDCKEYLMQDITTVRWALQSKQFLNITFEMLSDILHINDSSAGKSNGLNHKDANTPGISISEIELFKACNSWAESECKRHKIDPTGTNKRNALGECLSLIRFPTMLQKDLANIVYPTGILTPVEFVNLHQYIHREPGSECKADFPTERRQFVWCTEREGKTLEIESEVRVMLTRIWIYGQYNSGTHKVLLSNKSHRREWSMTLSTKEENHKRGITGNILPYLDIEPQVLEADTRYQLTTERLNTGQDQRVAKQPYLEYIRIHVKPSPYKEVKIKCDYRDYATIYGLTLSLV